MKVLAPFLLACPLTVLAGEIFYDIPSDGEMADALKPYIFNAPNNVNKSLRMKHIKATDKDIYILVRVGAIDTTKPKNETFLPDKKSVLLTKQNIVNSYCAPFGGGNLFFDTLKQRNATLHYAFEAGSDVTFLSFSVGRSDCD